jgi:hypothetical protein
MCAGLFAQIGLLAHLFSVLVPTLGAQAAGLAMGFTTACAIAGRMLVARLLPAGTNRRVVAALAYGVQLAGSMVLLCVEERQIAWILLGVALFGSGIGNATSLPPSIAQAEFAKEDVPRVVALIVAMAQASYSFAPALCGFVLSAATAGDAHLGNGHVGLLAGGGRSSGARHPELSCRSSLNLRWDRVVARTTALDTSLTLRWVDVGHSSEDRFTPQTPSIKPAKPLPRRVLRANGAASAPGSDATKVKTSRALVIPV